MYKEHLGLGRKPFQNDRDTDFFFKSEEHEEALIRLLYAASENKRLSVLVGDSGVGKTYTVSRFVQDMIQHDNRVAFVQDPRGDDLNLFQSVCYEFGVPYSPKFETKAGLISILKEIATEEIQLDNTAIIIIDQAHLVENDTLDMFKILMDLSIGTKLCFQLFLIGEPPLLSNLNNRGFRDRIEVRCVLHPLFQDEVGTYLEHRLKMAGREKGLFTEKSTARLFEYTKGLPRLINILADMCLLLSYGKREQVIDEDIVLETIEDYEKL